MRTFPKMMALALTMSLAAPTVFGQERAQSQHDDLRQIEVTILGMSCPFCVYGVNELLVDTVEKAGFDVAKITRAFESEFPDFDREATD